MTEPTFGISFLRDDDEPRPAIESDLSVIGFVGPMADAQNGILLNDPITFNSDDVTTLNALGTTNLIVDAINGINDHLGELQRAARIVLVRTVASSSQEANTKFAEETAGIVGGATEKTGLHALKQAGLLVLGVGVDDRLEGRQDFFDGLQEFGLIRVLGLGLGKNSLNVSVHDM